MLLRKLFNKKNKLGFTLIEIVVAITIMAIFTAVLAPSLIKYMEDSRAASDESMGKSLVDAVHNAMGDPAVFDEVYHYAVSNNFITYSDSSGMYGSMNTDEEYWAPDGLGWATTITFNPAASGASEYLLSETIINDMTYNNGSVVSPARVLEDCDAYVSSVFLPEMTTDDVEISGALHRFLERDFGNRIELSSRTYNQSSFTVFVVFEIIGDNVETKVHGSFNGTNLDPTCKAAVGTGTTGFEETPDGPVANGTGSGTTDAVFDFSALAGGGISSNISGSTGAVNNIKDAKTNAVLDKNKFTAFCQSVPNKAQIQNIKFVAAGNREDTTDVSINGDGSVIAWVDGLDICVSAKENNTKFFAPVDASNLFNVDYTGMPNVISISTIYADMSKTTSIAAMFKGNTNAVSIDMTGQKLSSCLDMSYLFSGCENLKTLRMSNTDTSKVTNMSGVFENCKRLSSFPYSTWNTSNVTNMSSMFKGCSNLKTLNVSSLNVSKVVDFGHMFEGCSRIKALDLSSWGVNIDNGRIFTAMFKDCLALQTIDFTRWEISGEVTNLGEMFASCKSLKELDTATLFTNGTSKCVDFNRMFYDCAQIKELDLGKFNTSKAADMDAMFDNMIRLQTIRLGGSFAFSGNGNTRCYLPEPSSLYIEGANGTWSNQAGISYYPREVPSRRDDIYSAVNFVVPAVLAPRNTWWKSSTDPATITRIVIANSFTGGTYSEKWSADVDNTGSLEVYINGNIAYIVNNQNKKPSNAFMLSEDASNTFSAFTNLTTIDGAKLINTVNVSNMNNFFGRVSEGAVLGCTKLTSVKDIEQWNMANVQTADYMFAGTKITNLTLSQWQVPNLQSAEGMFYSSALTVLDINGWDLSSAANLAKMFAESKSLLEIKANNMKVNKSAIVNDMFTNCSSLTTINTTVDFDLSASTPIVEMFRGCVKLQGNSGTKYSEDRVTNAMAHIDNGSSGYFTGINSTTGIITARVYEQAVPTGSSQVLTTNGIDIQWDRTKGTKLVEIKLSSLPRNREKTLTIQAPMGIYIVKDKWTTVNDDISNVVFTAYDMDTATSGLQQGTGTYTNAQTGTLTYTIAPYTKDVTITLQIMMDETLWDKNTYNPSTTQTGSLEFRFVQDNPYLTKEDVLTITLDEVEVKKIKNAASIYSVGAATHGWGVQYSIWQQNNYFYINDLNYKNPSKPSDGYQAPFNGNYIETIGRTDEKFYYKSVDYETWCEQTASDGSLVYARYVNATPAAQGGKYTVSSTDTVYKVHWDNIVRSSTNIAFPCIVFQTMEEDGFVANKEARIKYKVTFETFAGRKVTITRTLKFTVISVQADFNSVTMGNAGVTTLDESHYADTGATGWLGTFRVQNEKKANIPNVTTNVIFDNATAVGQLPKLKVSFFRAPVCANQTVDFSVLLINDSGNPAGPFTYSQKSSSTSSHSVGAPLYANDIASKNSLTGNWYIKEVNYVIPEIAGGLQRTYLYGSGSDAAYSNGGMVIGVANAKATSKMTMKGLNASGQTVTKSTTLTTNVFKPSSSDTNTAKFSGRIASITANSDVTAGEAVTVTAQLEACNYPGTTASCSILFTRPVLYLVLPDGMSIDEESIVISNVSQTTALAEPILTYIKSMEKSGALYNVYKISFNDKVPFGYYLINGKSITAIDSAKKNVTFTLITDSAMPSSTINWQNTIFLTDAYGNIRNADNTARFAANQFYDVDDVDNDGNTNERFASIDSNKYLTIN